jgi:hypothetical protein
LCVFLSLHKHTTTFALLARYFRKRRNFVWAMLSAQKTPFFVDPALPGHQKKQKPLQHAQ